MSRAKICCPVDGVVNHFLAAKEILEKNVIVYNENLGEKCDCLQWKFVDTFKDTWRTPDYIGWGTQQQQHEHQAVKMSFLEIQRSPI